MRRTAPRSHSDDDDDDDEKKKKDDDENDIIKKLMNGDDDDDDDDASKKADDGNEEKNEDEGEEKKNEELIEVEEEGEIDLTSSSSSTSSSSQPTYVRKETEFQLAQHVLRYAHPSILSIYITTLSHYAMIPLKVMTSIITLFKRISTDRALEGMFFQLSLFDVFERVLNDSNVKKQREFDEMRKFAKSIIRKFLDLASKNK